MENYPDSEEDFGSGTPSSGNIWFVSTRRPLTLTWEPIKNDLVGWRVGWHQADTVGVERIISSRVSIFARSREFWIEFREGKWTRKKEKTKIHAQRIIMRPAIKWPIRASFLARLNHFYLTMSSSPQLHWQTIRFCFLISMAVYSAGIFCPHYCHWISTCI